MALINDPFSRLGAPAKAKFILLGSTDFLSESLMNRARSLNIEHVSLVRPERPEISRRPASAEVEEVNQLMHKRRWFFTRKPDAGFVLSDFPATLLQAKVFDEWLDARDESLNGVVAGPGSLDSLVQYYRTLGLVLEVGDFAA